MEIICRSKEVGRRPLRQELAPRDLAAKKYWLQWDSLERSIM